MGALANRRDPRFEQARKLKSQEGLTYEEISEQTGLTVRQAIGSCSKAPSPTLSKLAGIGEEIDVFGTIWVHGYCLDDETRVQAREHLFARPQLLSEHELLLALSLLPTPLAQKIGPLMQAPFYAQWQPEGLNDLDEGELAA